MKKQIIIILIYLAFVPAVLGQQNRNDKKAITDLLIASSKMYESNSNYMLQSSYKLFSDYSSAHIVENYEGIFLKRGSKSYCKIHNTEFVNLDSYFLHIDNESKLIEYSNKTDLQSGLAMFDFMKFIDKFSAYTLTNKGEYSVCTLTSDKITFVPYSKVVVYIHNETKQVTKEILYLLTPHSYKQEKNIKKSYPRLEIEFNNFNVALDKKYDNKFNLANYVKLDKGKFHLSTIYQGYNLID